MFSLKKFFEWAVKEGYLDENPVEEFLKSEAETVETKLGKIERQKKLATPSYNSTQARIVAKLAGIPRLQKLAYHVFYSRPKWYTSYHNLPIAGYFNYAILVLLMSGLGFGIYNQFFKAPSTPLAYPTALTRASRYLSFQGRLTNNLGNPITTSRDFVFKLYSVDTGGSPLWNSSTCAITPDTDGIFSTLLGSTCGTEIPASVFSENAAVWLGVTVGTDTEATPRVQIATVAYALNSETLQGYPASQSATANTIPAINSSGQLVLGSTSPKIQSTSGTFAIEGQAMTISTPDTSNGSIAINPDGTGTLNLIFEGAAPGGSAGGFVNATNANITSGSLYYGSVASNATGYNLLQLQSGSSPTNKFVVDYAGNVTAAGTINGLTMTSGTISSGTWNGTAIGTGFGGTGQDWDSVARGSIPFFNGTGTMSTLAPTTAGYVLTTQGASADPTWTAATSVGVNHWQLANDVLAPINVTNDLAIGGNATSSAKFQVFGKTGDATMSGSLTIANGQTIKPAYGPLTLSYKSAADTWTAGLTIADVSGNVTLASDLAVNGGDITSTGDLTINPVGGDVNLGASDNLGLTAASNLIFGGTTSLGETTGAADSGAYVVGAYDDFTYSTSTNVQGVLKDFDTKLGTLTGNDYWQLNNKILSPANTTYDLTIGGSATGSAFQVFAATGNVTLADLVITGGNINPSANLTIGDNGDTLTLDSSDWDIGATGDMTGIGAITADGTISFTGATIGLGTSNSVTTISMGTGTGGNTFNIATNNTTKDTLNIGSALDDIIINGAGTGSKIDFANFDVATTGEITTASDINVNGSDIKSTGTLVVTPTSTLTLNSTGDMTLDSSTDIILDADGADVFLKDATVTFATLSNTGTDLTIDAAGGDIILGASDNLKLTAASNLFLDSDTALTDTALNDAGAYGVGTYDEFTYSSSTNVQDVLHDLDTAIGGAGINYWALGTGTIYPGNTTLDLLIGNSATTSAKFAFKNVLTGTPTASISGATNVATFIDGNGNISSTNRNNITIGNSSTYNSTGNVLINPNGVGKVAIASTAPLGSDSFAGNALFTLNSPAESSARERLLYAKVSDASSYFTIFNTTSSNSEFIPVFAGYHPNGQDRTGLIFHSAVPETGTLPALSFRATSNDYSTALATRPLFAFGGGASGNTVKMMIWPAGQVDIGTNVGGIETSNTVPNAQLQVQTSGTTDILNLLETGGAEVFTVLENGNVGIGAASPSTKLDVNGNLNVSGYATMSASLALGNTTAAVGPGHLNMSGNLTAGGNLDVNGSTNDIAGTLNLSGNTLTSTGDLTLNPTGGDVLLGASDNLVLTSAANLFLDSDTALSDTALNDAGAYGVGTYDEFSHSSSTNVQDVLHDLDAAIDGASGTNHWQLSNNILAPINVSNDLAIGGSATSSAKFQVFGKTGDATMSGSLTIANGQTIKSAYGPLVLSYKSTANAWATGLSLIDVSGNVLVANDINSSAATANLFNATTTTLNIGGAATSSVNIGPGSSTGTSINLAGGSSATGCTVDGATGNLTCSGTLNGLTVSSGTISSGTWNGTAVGAQWGGTGANNSSAAQYSVPYYSAAGVLGGILTPGTDGYVLTTHSTGGAPTWTAATSVGVNHWQLGSNVLAPINVTNDLSLGGTATASSKFQIMGATGNIYTANNTIDWTLNNAVDALNIDSNTLSLDASNNRVGIGTASPSYELDVAGSAAFGTSGYKITLKGESSGGAIYNTNTSLTIAGGASPLAYPDIAQIYVGNNDGVQILGSNTGGQDITIDPRAGGGNIYLLTGNVGVGTTDTSAKLDVVGNFELSGYATMSASLALGNVTAAIGPGHLNMSGNLTMAGNLDVNGSTNDIAGTLNLSGNTLTSTGDLTLNPTGGDVLLGASDNLVLTAASNLFLDSDTALTDTGLNDAGAYGIGTYDEFTRSSSTNVQDVLHDLDTAIGTAGTNHWQLANNVLAPINVTNDLAIGGSATSSAKFQVIGATGDASSSGSLTFRGTTDPKINILNGESFGIRTSVGGDTGLAERFTILNNGNVGIGGVTSPSTPLHVAGNVIFEAPTTAMDFAFKDSDVSTWGYVSSSQTNSFAAITELSTTEGGAHFKGGSDGNSQTALKLSGIMAVTDPTDATPVINLVGSKLNITQDQVAIGNLETLLRVDNFGSSVFTILGSGNTGVGTVSPLSKLSVVGTAANAIGKAAFLVDQYESQDILTASASGQTKMTLKNDGTLSLYNATSTISNTSGDITINAASGLIAFSGDNIGNIGNITAAGVLNAGGKNGVAYNTFAGSGDSPSSTSITTTNDLFIGGDTELKGGLYLTGKNIFNVVSGVSTGAITLASDPATINNYNALSYGSWLVNNSTNNGMAALMVNQGKGGDIFSASASGSPKMTLTNTGYLGLGTTAPAAVFDLVKTNSAASSIIGSRVNLTQSASGAFTSFGNRIILNASHTSGTLSGAQANSTQSYFTGSGGTTNYAEGITSWAQIDAGAIVSNLALMRIFNPSNSGTLTNLKGLQISNMSEGSSTNYSIYSEGGMMYHAGAVGIGTSSPGQMLDVAGNVSTRTSGGGFYIYTTGVSFRSAFYDNGTYTGLFGDGNGATAALAIDSNNIGIGTTAPSAKLFVSTSTANDGIVNTDGTRWTRFLAGTTAGGSYNPIVQANDNAIIYTAGTTGTGGMVIAPWSGSAAGIRINGSGNTVFNGSLLNTTGFNSIGDQSSMVPNSGFEVNDDTTTTLADSWVLNSNTTGSNPSVTTDSYQGAKAMTLYGTSSTEMSIISGCFPITYGTTYNLYAFAKSNVASGDGLYLRVFYYSDGACATYSGYTDTVTNSNVSTSWTKYGNTSAAINGKSAKVLVYHSGPTTTSTITVDSVRFVPSALTNAIDIAENYYSDENLQSGQLVKTSSTIASGVSATSQANELSLIGIVSTNPAMTLGDGIVGEGDQKVVRVALSGRVPAIVTSENGNIKSGDYISPSSSILGAGSKSVRAGRAAGIALEDKNWETSSCQIVGNYSDIVWPYDSGSDRESRTCFHLADGTYVGKIMIFVNPTWHDPGVYLAESGELQITGQENMEYQLTDSNGNGLIESVGAFAKLVVANIKAGAIATEELATDSLTAFQGTVDNMLVKSGLVAGRVETKLISPIPGEDLAVELPADSKFKVQDSNQKEVASIDSSGNATFSGTLYAEEIKSKSLDEIQALLTDVKTDQELLAQASSWSITATNSASLDEIATADLYVTNQAAINSLSVTNSLTLGIDMVIQTLGTSGLGNSIDTLTSPLRIQSLAMAPVEIMAGLIKIDTAGNVQIAGNLAVGGRVESSGLTLTDKQQFASPSANLLTLQDSSGNTVSTVDASGSATFASLSTQGLTIAGAVEATNSAVVDGVITTNATAGSGVIRAETSEITIKNKNVTDYTLVYVTPTSSTDNYVLYVKSKAPGEFVVGFTNPISVDVNFNWWIVKVTQ